MTTPPLPQMRPHGARYRVQVTLPAEDAAAVSAEAATSGHSVSRIVAAAVRFWLSRRLGGAK